MKTRVTEAVNLHMSEFMSNDVSRANPNVFYDGAATVSITHCAQLR